MIRQMLIRIEGLVSAGIKPAEIAGLLGRKEMGV
jgi:hypothetical protein